MVIPTGTSFEKRNISLLDNEFQTKWSERPARLQHRFLVLRKLGQGTYGKVQLALNKETNQEVAIKTIKKARIESEEDMLRIRREIHIMKSIRHPYIIHIHEVFETRQKIVIVMQYANGGELYDYLGCHNTLPEEEARRIFRQIVSAIYYCHKNKICHRDLKLENILLDDVGNAQIADFGLSNIFDDRRRMNTFCGSPLYASPEIVKGTPYKGPEVDCWSLGVLLYTLIYGTMPFDGRNFKDLVSQISEGRYEEPANKSSASSLIRRLLTPDISRRATISDVCLDAWVNEGYSASLLSIAEQMAWDAALKTKTLSVPHLEKNGHGPVNSSVILKKPKIPSNSTNIPSSMNVPNSVNGTNSMNSLPRNSALHEQILNYDVSFIINKLLVAVESSVAKSETLMPPPKEKIWPQNGENNVASKVESAYVIPIFEVTSVMPKNNKMVKNQNFKENSEHSMKLTNGVVHKNSEAVPKKEVKNSLKNQRKGLSNETKLGTTKDVIDTNRLPSNEHSNSGLPIIQITGEIEPKVSNDMLQVKKVNSFTRIPSVKTKRVNENCKFASKHFGPFFRTTNNALSLARIFSSKYEKLVRNSIKAPERKKLPGKIAIPSTFDPSTPTVETAVQERKQIVLFPTVSVSENKDKIEKKIEKIKKAALNMTLIKRSTSANRLKIQKYLLSQAKKIQDLICDEQRNSGSTEQLNGCEMFTSETYNNQFEKGNIHSFSIRQHKRMNFMHPDSEHCNENGTLDFARMKIFPQWLSSTKQEYNFRLCSIAKSKSDVQFPSHFTNSNESYSSIISSNSSNEHFTNTHSLSVSNCNIRIQRSASDSEGLNFFRNAFESDKYEGPYKIYQNDTNTSYSKSSNPIFDAHSHKAALQNDFIGYIQSTEENFKKSTKVKESYDDKDTENKTIHRSKSVSICEGLQNTNYDYIMKHLSSMSTLGTRCWNHENGMVSKSKTDVHKIEPLKSIFQSICENPYKSANQKVLNRRNSFGCVADSKVVSPVNKMYDSKNTGDEIVNNGIDHLWAVYKKQALSLTHPKNENNFSSSPILYPLDMKTSCYDSKSLDSFPATVNGDFSSDSTIKSRKTSAFLRRILQESNDYGSDPFPSRSKSTSEDTFSSDESNDKLRKFSLPPGLIGSQTNQKSPFLSKFLNDLENREQNLNTKDSNLNHRRYPRNSFTPGKRPKLEKKSKSFLQLLSLKRIQEAEKELDKAERNTVVDAEEGSVGSLLEALKTHGYKGVISQLSGGTDSNSLDTYNAMSSKSPFLLRKLAPDISRYNTMYYDSLPQLTSPTYELNQLPSATYDLNQFSSPTYDLNQFTSPTYDLNHLTSPSYDLSDYDLLNGLSPYSSPSPLQTPIHLSRQKQYAGDWLNVDHKIPYSYEASFDPEEPVDISETAIPYWAKETSKSDDKAESMEALNNAQASMLSRLEEDQPTNASVANELAKKQIATDPLKSERSPLVRASSTSEDEREESVQDRIWRKSFYSRFNNSALSRKEKSTFFESEFSPESRAMCSSPFKINHRERGDSAKWNKDLQSKRIHTARKYSLMKDSTGETNLSKPYESASSNENSSFSKCDDSDPEH